MSYKQPIFGSFGAEKEEARMRREDNILLLQEHVVLSADAFCTLFNTPLWQMHMHCHTLANIGSFAGCSKIISSCLLMERKQERFGNNYIL